MSGTQEEVRVVHPPHGGKIPLTVLNAATSFP